MRVKLVYNTIEPCRFVKKYLSEEIFMDTAIAIRNLYKRYGDNEAVKDVSLEVKNGEIFGLLGPNGAGKTTTIRCLCALAKPDKGDLEVGGISVAKQPRQARRRLGYVAQEVALDKVLTGRELLQLQASLYHLKADVAKAKIQKLASLLDIEDIIDTKTGKYSGGQRRRLDLAAGLLHEPPVLVLDEPTVGLDIESRLAVWNFLRQLKSQGTTILITSHYLEEIDALADRVAIIDRGKTIDCGTPGELKDKIGGDRITLRIREFTPTEEAEKARDMLQSLPIVRQAIVNTAQGNTLNLVVDSQSDALSTIQSALQAAGLPTFGIAQSRPSLDDVYLAATGQTLLDADLAATQNRDPKSQKKENMA
jgi:ABC-2 type transport system ATP-binding protein